MLTEKVSDLILSCSGGTVLAVNIRIFLNAAVTSRIVRDDLTEALLLVDGNVVPGRLAGSNSIVFSAVPLDPPGSDAPTPRVLRITNPRANANFLGLGGPPTPAIAVAAFTAGAGYP